MPARRVFLAAAVLTLPLAAAVVVPWLLWAGVAGDVLLIAALIVDHRRASRTAVHAERRWPLLLIQGAAAEVEVRLSADATAGVTVALREGLHPGLAESPLRHRLTLAPGEATTWSYRLTPRRRGAHLAAPLTARVLGPWRLAWAQRDLIAEESVRIYPQVRWEGRVARLLELAHRRQLGQIHVRYHGLGSEPYALREYLPGDPPNRIHWKATARHGRLVAREDTFERGGRVVILLDCARAMAAVDGGRSKLDHALAAALALTRVAAARGDRITWITFSDRIERLVRVRATGGGVSAAYRALFDCEARLVEPAYDLAAEATCEIESRRAAVVLFTSVVDLAAAELLREALLRLEIRHRPLLINLEDAGLGALARGVPASTEEAFAKVSSLEILLANQRLARRLRRAGVRAVTASADTLALATLESYLAMLRGRTRSSRLAASGVLRRAG